MARPTDYTPELVEKAESYLHEYQDQGDVIPSVAGLALFLGISRTCVYDWAKQEGKEKFSYILDDILSKQENVLINSGLSGKFNSNITKLVLGKHGYSERQETTHKGGLTVVGITPDDEDVL